VQTRQTRVVLAAAHLDHNPRNNRVRNLRSLCQRCHMIHDRPHHLAQRRITYLLRRALGDLFLGPIRFISHCRRQALPRHLVANVPHDPEDAALFRGDDQSTLAKVS
jgi:hypothetical protein